MIDTVIVSGGNIQYGFALDFLKKIIMQQGRTALRLIAADKGMEFFIKSKICPDMVVGDFDSLSLEGQKYLDAIESKNIEIIRLKPEKDDSDTQSAVNIAIGLGAKKIAVLGGTGTRLDHVMANLGMLVMAKKRDADLVLVDENNYITLAYDGMKIKKTEQFGKYVSFFPLGEPVKGLSLTGFQYGLNGYDLQAADSGFTVSNEIKDDQAQIHFQSGNLIMIMSRD